MCLFKISLVLLPFFIALADLISLQTVLYCTYKPNLTLMSYMCKLLLIMSTFDYFVSAKRVKLPCNS